MEEQVLTIAEMQALQELGIDTTKANMFWVKEMKTNIILLGFVR